MIGKGLLAGAAGTIALDLSTYVDMFVRGRPSSEMPANMAREVAKQLGIDSLADGNDDAPKNRRSALGAMMGYGVGLGAGVGYAAVRPAFRGWLPWPIAGLLLGGATLVFSEGTATKLGVTDWSKWTTAQWLSDIIPRALYGLVAAYAYHRLTDTEE